MSKREEFLNPTQNEEADLEDPDEGRLLESEYRKKGWYAVRDADAADDRALLESQERLHRQGVKTEIVHNQHGATLKRWGGYVLRDLGPKPQ